VASVPQETNVPTAGVPPIVAQNPKNVAGGVAGGGAGHVAEVQSGAGVGETPMGSPNELRVNPRSFLVKAVACPEIWLIKVGDPTLGLGLPFGRVAPAGITPKYAGSVPQSAGSAVPLPIAAPHFVGLAGPVTITGSWNVIIACGVDEFVDAASWNPNCIPSWAALGGGFVPVPGMPVTVPARQPGADTAPLQVAAKFKVAVTGVSLLSLFNITSGNVKLPTA